MLPLGEANSIREVNHLNAQLCISFLEFAQLLTPVNKLQSMAKAKKTAAKKASGQRTLISPNGDKRYVQRNVKGQITESDDQGKSLSQDVKKHSKTAVTSGQGDKGDRPRNAEKKSGTSTKRKAN